MIDSRRRSKMAQSEWLNRRTFLKHSAVAAGAAFTTAPMGGPGAVEAALLRVRPDLGIDANMHGARPFPDDNVWNKDISALPVDPNSANILATIGLDTGLHPDFGSVFGIP